MSTYSQMILDQMNAEMILLFFGLSVGSSAFSEKAT